MRPYCGNDEVELASVGLSLHLDTVIFEDVDENITAKPKISEV